MVELPSALHGTRHRYMTAEEVLAAILDSNDENNGSLLSSDEESSMYIDTDAENVPDPCFRESQLQEQDNSSDESADKIDEIKANKKGKNTKMSVRGKSRSSKKPRQVDGDPAWEDIYETFQNPHKDAPFLEYTGINRPAANAESVLNHFLLFFPLHVVDKIVDETNTYYQQLRSEKQLSGEPFEMTIEELLAFLGINIAMGLAKLPTIEDYWRKGITHMPWFRSVMPRRKFQQVLRFLHLADNSKQLPRSDPNYNKLYKLGDLMACFNKCFKEMYAPRQNLSIDEQMIGTKLRIGFLQYMLKKPKKFGMGLELLETDILIQKSEEHPVDSTANAYQLIESSDEDDKINENWISISSLQLTKEDKEIMQFSDMWLNDRIINAVQFILKKQFPLIEGFQDTLLQKASFKVMSGEFMQIINKSGNHWMTLSALGINHQSSIKIFDSMNSKVLNHNIASVIMTKNRAFHVKVENVQQQPDSYNCGLFAIAFATHLCFQQNPRFLHM
eukprot:gene6511-11974_t